MTTTDSDSQHKQNKLDTNEIDAATQLVQRLHWFVTLGIIVTIIVVTIFIVQFHNIAVSTTTAEWGQLGDYIGGLLNPTFSFLALIALITTLRLQITELKNSAKELKISSNALVKQNDTMRQQTFEATFFQLLRLHNDIVLALLIERHSGSGKTHSTRGRECISYILSYFKSTPFYNIDGFLIAYESFHSNYEATLDHYFRLLYNIIKLIHKTNGIDKQLYANLVRAQLSSVELELLFYNGLSKWGRDKFKPLIEEYALLKHIPRINQHGNLTITVISKLVAQYSKEAFGGNYPEWNTIDTAAQQELPN